MATHRQACGWYFAHLMQRILVVGKNWSWSVDSYAERKGMSKDDAERCCTNLGYDFQKTTEVWFFTQSVRIIIAELGLLPRLETRTLLRKFFMAKTIKDPDQHKQRCKYQVRMSINALKKPQERIKVQVVLLTRKMAKEIEFPHLGNGATSLGSL